MAENNRFSQSTKVFQGYHLPEEDMHLAGYSAIIHAYELCAVPLPQVLCAISVKARNYQKNNWRIYPPRYQPDNSLSSQLVFAMKYEGVDLSVLKALFDNINSDEIKQIIENEPTGSYSRRIWFFYEWLTGRTLDVPDAKRGNFVKALDPKLQYEGPRRPSTRHRVHNNLPGVKDFCPLIRKTSTLEKYTNISLDKQAKEKIAAVHPDLLLRAAAFLLLKDTKASFAIEGEWPSPDRAQRWADAVAQAGAHALSLEEFLRLQEIVISDFRFTHYGYRNEDGFIGEHDRSTHEPIPDHISARPQDIQALMESLIETETLLRNSEYDPVLSATSIAFGFVFIHPFADGNGRIHRYLIHHVLAEKDFVAKGIIFPVSAIILENIDKYKAALESYSRPRRSLIKWLPTENHNVEVLNDTIDLYRYFDATKQAEFLYQCIHETVNKTLPDEVSYLKSYDAIKTFIINHIEMPDHMIDLMIKFLEQGKGHFSKRARTREFAKLTDKEVAMIEEKYIELFS